MTNIDRVRVALNGFPGAPGVCTFFGLSGADLIAPLQALWAGFVTQMPVDVSVHIEAGGDTLNDTNGDLVATWSGSPTTDLGGTATGVYSAPSGAAVTWLTDQIVDSHRLRGRTYVVPLGNVAYQDDGSIHPDALTFFRALGAGYVADASANAVVWHRPRVAKPADGSRPAITARAGSHGLITGSSVTDAVAVLRSRRD